jgi:hydrogenase maturation protease
MDWSGKIPSMAGGVQPRVLVLGIGNVGRTDDGLGVHAVRLLVERYRFAPSVQIVEAGTRAIDFLEPLTAAELAVLVDAMEGPGPAGTIYRLAAEKLPEEAAARFSGHSMGAVELLQLARQLGRLPTVRIIAMQPLDARSLGMKLTAPVRERLSKLVETIVGELAAAGFAGQRAGQ